MSHEEKVEKFVKDCGEAGIAESVIEMVTEHYEFYKDFTDDKFENNYNIETK